MSTATAWRFTPLLSSKTALALLLLAPAPAMAIECGDLITGDARLDRNLICPDPDDPALTVAGGRLDLGGFAVVCDQTSVGILLDGQRALLTNGAVTGCEVAVWVGGDGDHTVSRVTASASNQGVFIASDRNQLLGSHVLRGLDDAAVQVDGSDNFLGFNAVGGSTDQGFEVNGDHNRLLGNRIGAVAEGIQFVGEGNQARSNHIIGTTERGVEVREGAHLIFDNLIADGLADGIVLFSDGNHAARNRIYGHGDQGLFVSGRGNTLEENEVLLNATDLTDTTEGCDDNVWRNNTFETAVSDDCVQ